MMNNVRDKSLFSFFKIRSKFFNAFNTFFQALETRIHLLQPKSENFFFKICQNVLKEEYLKTFSSYIIFSLKKNQKAINEVIF